MQDRQPPQDKEDEGELIDRIRHDIRERLEQLVPEAEKLRRALPALDPREKPKPKSTLASTLKSTRKRTPKPGKVP